MIIRKTLEQDILPIVNLLKQSLGESLMPKSELFWRWKHSLNPFGKSPVLVAEENTELIGVRAFMVWNWNFNARKIVAARAVDTATHPDHQGKGIFKKLTLQLIEECKNDEIYFIFNTPNKNSMPGYIKMGWQVAGKLPIRFRFFTPFEKLFYKSKSLTLCSWTEFEIGYKETRNTPERITTPKNIDYLKWRYQQVPVASYAILRGEENEYVIYRIKAGKLKELRIVEYLSERDEVSSTMWKRIKIVSAKNNINVITVSGKTQNFNKGVLLTLGPIVTVRNIKDDVYKELISFKNWSPSLGDLELF